MGRVLLWSRGRGREFQGSTPGCLGPNPDPYLHNTHTHTPKGVGVLTLCGFTPGWGTYPLVHKYIGKNIVLLFTIYNEITTFM